MSDGRGALASAPPLRENGDVTGAPPHDLPSSRRAVRAQRERMRERAPEAVTEVRAPPPTRRSVRAGRMLGTGEARRHSPVRHARVNVAARVGVVLALAVAGTLVVGSAAAVTAVVAPPLGVAGPAAEPEQAAQLDDAAARLAAPPAVVAPGVLQATRDETSSAEPASAPVDVCSDPAVTAALQAGDDAATIAAAGGAHAFRALVSTGLAPCVPLNDPGRVWVLVDKMQPFAPIDYRPSPLALPENVRSLEGGMLRVDAAAALTALAEASRSAAGEIAVESAYRSFDTQADTHAGHVAEKGAAQADVVSARPGYSEHQSGLAVDVVPCDDGCGRLDDLASSPQGAWIAAHAWEFGWIVRYEEGATPVTGYLAEPWHLRYIGVDLAAEYHAGGWRTLEEFLGVAPAPDYPA